MTLLLVMPLLCWPRLLALSALALTITILAPSACLGQEALPAPLSTDRPALQRLPRAADPIAIADTFLGIPYREDGAIDQAGRFTRFEHPDIFFNTAGLNCSGFVLAAARFLLGQNFTLASAQFDRRNDSGAQSPLGEHWDFGFDLVYNLTERTPRWLLLPFSSPTPPALTEANGFSCRGFGLHDDQAWNAVLKKLEPGAVYFATWSKPTRQNRAGLLHYHVSLILADKAGQVWLYQATPKSGVHRFDLASAAGRDRLHRLYAPGNREARILIVGVTRAREETGEKATGKR